MITGSGRNRVGIHHFSLQPLLGQALILQGGLSGSPIQMYASWSGSLPWRPEMMSLPPPTTAPSCPCCAVLLGQGKKARATGGFSAQMSHTLLWHSYASSLALMAIGADCILQSPWRGYIQRKESPRKCQGPKADSQGQVSSRLQSSSWLFQPV